jgi:hypothetical protein
MTVNAHLWALVTALGMFSGGAALAAVSLRGMSRTPFEGPWQAGPKWRGHAWRFAISAVIFFAAFIPLAVWFHYNPCISGCR